jgi:DNA-binding NarL/FixJ family response regulator
VRVLIADDQPQICSAVRLLLAQQPDVVVVGEARDLEQALVLSARRNPDLVLLDWELPGQSDVGALESLRALDPGLAVIALSGQPQAQQAALSAGADGFVSKGDPPERLLAAIDARRQATF